MPRIVANGEARRSYFKRKTEDGDGRETAKSHTCRIYRKLDANSREELLTLVENASACEDAD